MRNFLSVNGPANHHQRQTTCYHGGAFFNAIGAEFDNLSRRHEIINADVLDAWFAPSPKVIAALNEDLPWLLRTSPPTNCEGLQRVIARTRGVATENILPGAGSSDLIFLALRHWLKPSSRVLILDPTYGEYAHVLEKVVRCRVDRFVLSREENYQINLDGLGKQIHGGYDLIVLVNPNSPTGQYVPRTELEKLLRCVPRSTRIWIDETYIEYVPGALASRRRVSKFQKSRQAGGTPALPEEVPESLEGFAAASENVLICKSMSKVYALSGARAAYLCGPEIIIEELRPLTPPWAVSLPGQVAGVAALQDPEYYAARYAETHELREELAAQLALFDGWELLPGIANFLLCHLPEDGPTAAEIVSRCRARGLFLRDASEMGKTIGTHALRIAVKGAATNRRMIEILTQANNRLPGKTKSPSSRQLAYGAGIA